jgi:hypothetical protein
MFPWVPFSVREVGYHHSSGSVDRHLRYRRGRHRLLARA